MFPIHSYIEYKRGAAALFLNEVAVGELIKLRIMEDRK